MPFYTHLMYLWFILPEWLWWLFVVCFCSTPLQSQNSFQSALKSQHYSLLVGTRPSSNSIFDKVQCIVFQRLPDFSLMEIRTLYFLYLQTLWFTAINKFFLPASGHITMIFGTSHLPFVPLCWVLAVDVQALGFVIHFTVYVVLIFPVLFDSLCHPEQSVGLISATGPLSQKTKDRRRNDWNQRQIHRGAKKWPV